MVEHQFRIAEIEVAKSPTDEKIVGIFRYEGNGQTKKSPTLIMLAEIMSTAYAYERLLDTLNAAAEQTKHLVAGVEQDPIARFEKLIQRLNEAVAHFVASEPTPISWNRVNIFVMELSGDQLCLAGLGRLTNVFLQKQDDGSFRTFDLFGSLDQPAEVDPQKPFASLICGDIKIGDVLFAGTANLERLRNELMLKERLTTKPPVSAALDIRQDLERRNIPDDFLGVVIAACALQKQPVIEKPATPAAETPKSTASINKLRETEHEAIQHLSPVVGPTAEPLRATAKIPSRLLTYTRELAGRLGNSFSRNRTTKDVAAMASLRGMNAGHGTAFTQKHKTTLIAVGVLAIGITSGGLLWHRSRVKTAEAASWQAAFGRAQDEKNRAESDLVYLNDSRALKEIQAAEQLIAQLSQTTPERKKAVEGIQNEIKQLRERLRKVTPVSSVVEIAALAGAPDGTLVAPVLTKNAAFAVDTLAKEVLKIDLATKTVKRIPLPKESDAIVAGSLGTQSIVFTTAKGTFYGVNLQTDNVSSISTQRHGSSTTDIALYAGKAYSLDEERGQIWRAQSSASGFGPEQAYIKASSNPLTNAVSMAIDSNVYVLTSDGTVLRFLSGGQEGFALNPVDPPLRAASAIWTNAEATRIAVADPAEKRILLFAKDGSLKNQLVSPSIRAPRDLDGDEKEKRLLVIDGTRLLLVTTP